MKSGQMGGGRCSGEFTLRLFTLASPQPGWHRSVEFTPSSPSLTCWALVPACVCRTLGDDELSKTSVEGEPYTSHSFQAFFRTLIHV
ncbi:hypothetical protein SRHO_G00303760 [Serrasalmus rhombeus]